ncbi:cytochrome (ubi)quinol oxidase subunit III [Camelliibacillus cellulosilyticus]|uniref:Cytochrome (Ubi)quinol oxidase subunit III n=1 Tax=Camelliibacillus cellulosilyticus TaxID=2174486 RepID=A0ABV9GK33_9BACL
MSSIDNTEFRTVAEPEKATLEGKNKFLGFWFFLGGETVLFGTLFATFLALRDRVASGPSAHHLFSLTTTFASTIILLVSSLTSVFAVMAMRDHKLRAMQNWFWVTILLGLAFLCLEIYEFSEYLHEGLGYTTSAFSSSFYTLVGTHGGHVTFGILWIAALMIQSYKKGITAVTAPKYYVAALYWHFIDVVWVFIFTVVYLLGILGA